MSKIWKIAALTAVILLVFVFLSMRFGSKHEELTVSAAVSLKESFTEIGSEFEKEHPGTKVVFNFASSGELAQQIQQGAPADVFASAARDQMDALTAKGLMDSNSVRVFAKNRLVVIARTGHKISSFDDLPHLDRLAIGNPQTVPAGKYAMEALTKAKLDSTLKANHKLIYAENVRQVLTYVETGNVDAGIVYNTDAAISSGVQVCFSVPDSYTQAIVYPIGLVKASQHGKLAQEFIDLVMSPYGQKILRQKGFLQ